MSNPQKIYFEAPAEVEVEIAEGLTYNKLPSTKSVQRKIVDAITLARQSEEEDLETAVAMFCQVYDLILKPTGTNRKKASTYIRAQWDADEMTTEQMGEHLDRLGEVRPT